MAASQGKKRAMGEAMKRFTETKKWRDSWFLDLPAAYKLAYVYLLDECDPAGVWDPNKRLAEFSIGEKIDWSDFAKKMGSKLLILNDGKWLLTKFIEFQYGELSATCRPHIAVLKLIERYSSIGYPPLRDRVSDRVSDTLQDKDTDKDKEKDKDKEPDSIHREAVRTIPQELEKLGKSFRDAWVKWIDELADRGFGKAPTMQQCDAHLRKLTEIALAGGSPVAAIENAISRKLREPDLPLWQVAKASPPPAATSVPENVLRAREKSLKGLS